MNLTDAFGVLLGRPLDAFDPAATYALYHWDDMSSDEFDPEEADFGAVPPAPAAEADGGDALLSLERWRFDHARSLFLLDGGPVLGADADPAELAAAGYLPVVHRVVTDGTLLDAMKAATWTMSAPDGLVPLPRRAVVEPRWAGALSGVGDAALREHLMTLCLTPHWARSDGAWFAGTDPTGDLRPAADLPGHEVLAAWHFGEGQAASAVMSIKS
ncbi:hypothetical protein KZZ52_30630 [Dactylosporangium sp. AC04546]|uniref:hypothetical protein n=1 Tax=Dactylosporangium sp. AC04546 TaxID=2862460 RepID=UPI001EDD1DC1|nr:hypothetical protein [Dactylosporangium sp. AC04546]WVK78352.1 hypothetical protein KZZ52_30630 [Dactylosporangium sp. AC04546]